MQNGSLYKHIDQQSALAFGKPKKYQRFKISVEEITNVTDQQGII